MTDARTGRYKASRREIPSCKRRFWTDHLGLLFASTDFFDGRDLVQVKYEMVRRVRTEGQPVGQSARAFGFSRPSFYQAQAATGARGAGRPGSQEEGTPSGPQAQPRGDDLCAAAVGAGAGAAFLGAGPPRGRAFSAQGASPQYRAGLGASQKKRP